MSSPGINQGYRGYVIISPSATSPTRALVREGASLSMPRNLDTPYPIEGVSNGIINYADGVLFPSLSLPLVPLYDSTNQTTPYGWFSAANLNAWFGTYTTDDLAAVGSGGIDFADAQDGNGSFNVMNPKGVGYTLEGGYGEPISFTARFAGTNKQAPLAAVPTTGLNGAPLQQNLITFGGTLAAANNINRFTLDVDLGTTPNPVLNGTLAPTEQNAGILTARLRIRYAGRNAAALADAAGPASIIIGPTGTPLATFTMANLVAANPNDRQSQTGRVFREFEYLCLATATSMAVVIS